MDLYKIYEDFDHEIYPEIAKYNSQQEKENKLKFPFLLSSDIEEYNSAELKVMFFGQESLNWSYEEEDKEFYGDSDSIDDYINLYKGYMKVFYEGFKNTTPFNKECLRLESKLKNIFPSKKVGFLYNNLIKLTPHSRPTWNPKLNNVGLANYERVPMIKKISSLIKPELEFFKPNIIIFLTGPDYDGVLKQNIEISTWEDVEGFSKREFCKLNIPNVDLAIRTYHPGYLNRNQELKSKIDLKITELFNGLAK